MRNLTMMTVVCLLIAGIAQAGTIADIRGGLVDTGTIVTVEGAVVTSVLNSSVTISELPGGPGMSLWVITDGAPTVAVGDIVDLMGTYIEHNERATLSLLHPAEAHITFVSSGTAPMIFATVDQLVADPEFWESTVVMVTDGLIVQAIMADGNWSVYSFETGAELILNDYFGLFPMVSLGECYNNALGVYFRFEGKHVLKALEVEFVDCTVGNDDLQFGELKSLYR